MWHIIAGNKVWEYIGGSTTGLPVYGGKGNASSTYNPRARNRATTWTVDDNELWLFGGKGK
jgi:hypothetical protein